MPISDDEGNQYSNDSIPSTTMSKAELRKTHKPIMEKRRRAKINNCLNEIKHLILVAMKKDPERHSKLEKADILEMAVKHLKNMQRQQRDHALRTDPTVVQKYKAGFVECAEEVTNYVNSLEGVEGALKQRLIAHLMKCATNIERKPEFPFSSAFTPSSSLLASLAQNRFSKISSSTDDQNNNARIQGIEVIPSCLPNGEFAFVVPKSSFSSILSGHMNEDRPSAFVTVNPSKSFSDGLLKISKPLSPPVSPSSSEDVQRVGFQPVFPKFDSKISSTTTSSNPPEILNMKFPIQRKENISEPLCIITNTSERYKQASMLEETCDNEENIYAGMKRRFRDDSQLGLLTVASPEPPKKICKVDREAASSSNIKTEKDEDPGEGTSKNDSMWRPW